MRGGLFSIEDEFGDLDWNSSMPNWLVAVLLAVFVIHLIVFFHLFLRWGENYYLAASITFLLLVATFSVRLWWADAQLGGYSLFWVLRIAAWISAAISIGWLLRRRVFKKSSA